MSNEPITILIVDDKARNLDALEVILEDPSYRLIRADGADQALHVLLGHEVAAIVLDIQMPGVGGVELAQMIKGTKRFRQIPIVFLTAHMREDQDVIAGYSAGAVDYLTKPVNAQVLRLKIAVFADLSRKTRALAELNETLETRVQERTAALEQSEAALRTSVRQKDEFLAVLAHELRNPLAPLLLGVDSLVASQPPSIDTGRTLSMMHRQLGHMVRLIDDLLDVARIDRGTLELQKEPSDLAEVVQMAIETCRPFLDQRGQSVAIGSAHAMFAFVDPMRLAQIVGNLLHNASKFTPEGGQIRIELTRDGEDAIIRLIDVGAGIAPDQIGRIFDMFARGAPALLPSKSGLGIGLALSRQLAEMHGGSLTASSLGVGAGSTFTLSVPAAKSTEGQDVLAVSVPGPAADNGMLNVLVIDDNEDAAEMLTLWLRALGHVVHVAYTGLAGLDLVQQMRPQLVLCDIGMPGMDGFEVCTHVRALVSDFRPVMIALTGWGAAEDRRRSQEAGFDHHLVKPVAPGTLLKLLQTLGGGVAAS